MKKKLFISGLFVLSAFASLGLFSCNKEGDYDITVCASQIPHAEILNECVAPILKEKGYNLEVTELSWQLQNDGVDNGDYDANYFQHIPYLNNYNGKNELFAVCKVHYEALGIYWGTSDHSKTLSEGHTFAICNDVSNGCRAFDLLEAKGLISKEAEGSNYPVSIDEEGDEVFNFSGSSWQNVAKTITVKLISEKILVQSMPDYDFVLLPCNTASTGHVNLSERIDYENDTEQVSSKANVLAARKSDYENDAIYKAKIDVLANALLSSTVRTFIETKYYGSITCNDLTQVDLRSY